MNEESPIVNKSYEDTETVSKIIQIDSQLSAEFEPFHREILENYKKVAGKLLSEADLAKLRRERRPAFVANLIVPIVLNLAGNFIGNQSALETVARTMGDEATAKIINDILEYDHNTANDLNEVLLAAFLDAIIGRIGWIVQDWSYEDDPHGMERIKRYDLFRLKYDTSFSDRKLKTCNYILDSGFYSVEELQNMYAFDDDDLYWELEEKAKDLMGENSKGKLPTWMDRVFGSVRDFFSSGGYDNNSGPRNLSSDYFDQKNKMLKAIEFHERRQEKRMVLFDVYTGQSFDVTKSVKKDDFKTTDVNRRQWYDNDKLQEVRKQFLDPQISEQTVKRIWQTAVIPALNIKVYDAPAKLQNGNFKYTPIFCHNLSFDPIETRSVIDHISDPVGYYNKAQNTLLEYIMKLSSTGYTVRKGAIPEGHEDAWLSKEMGGLKYVNDLNAYKIDEVPPFPAALGGFAEVKSTEIKHISGVTDEVRGSSSQSNETGVLYNSKVEQANIQQQFIQDNANSAQVQIGKNSVYSIQKNMTEERVIRITGEESNPYWLTVNKQTVQGILNDVTKGDFDVIISKSPYGKAARRAAFNELMMLNQQIAQINPQYINIKTLVKASTTPFKQDIIARIDEVDQQNAMMQQMQQTLQQSQLQGSELQNENVNQEKILKENLNNVLSGT